MFRFTMSSLAFAASMLMGSAAFAGQCPSGQWWSDSHHRCFDKHGHCGQYNYTDSKTCNSGHDNLQCDWDHSSRTCYSSGHDSGGHQDKWWSEKYNRWYDKKGHCGQYSYTDSNTCNTGKDYLQCDWNHHDSTCYPSH